MSTAKEGQLFFWISLLVLPGVHAADTYSIGGLVGSAAVAFVFLIIVIVMLAVGFTWNNWFPTMMRGRGKVKMPRDYWKKKEEARLRLISGSRSLAPSEAGLPNGGTISRAQDTASWVQGWNNANPPLRAERAYEVKDLTMELGEEDKDEDFRIETTIVDNETLDLGPFHDDKPRQREPPHRTSTAVATLQLEDEEDLGLYSTVNKSRPTSVRSNSLAPLATSEEAVTSFSKMDQLLVAL